MLGDTAIFDIPKVLPQCWKLGIGLDILRDDQGTEPKPQKHPLARRTEKQPSMTHTFDRLVSRSVNIANCWPQALGLNNIKPM